MIKKWLVGFVWMVVIYFVSAMIVVAVAGAMARNGDPQHAAQAGRLAGEAAVLQYRVYLFLGALILAILGTARGWLPGTKTRDVQ